MELNSLDPGSVDCLPSASASDLNGNTGTETKWTSTVFANEQCRSGDAAGSEKGFRCGAPSGQVLLSSSRKLLDQGGCCQRGAGPTVPTAVWSWLTCSVCSERVARIPITYCSPTPEFNAHLTASRRLNSHVTSWRGFSREQLLDSFTVEHDWRDVTDGMWSPRKLSPDVISKSVQSLITVSKKLECEVQPVS